MRVRSIYTIEDGIYSVKVVPEDLSSREKDGVAKYGEPTINLGGNIVVFPEIVGISYANSEGYLVDLGKEWEDNSLIGRVVLIDSIAYTITSNTNNTLSADGLSCSVDDIYAVRAETFYMENEYAKTIKDAPFVKRFDSRTTYVNPIYEAEDLANAWGGSIGIRLKQAYASLIKEDSYTREDII